MLKKCEDNYFTTFSSPVVMLDYHEQLERESKWHRCKVNTLQVEPLNESSPLYGNLSAFASGISQDAVEDTSKNLGFAALPLLRQKVLEMLFVQELTPLEISKRMHCSVKYVYDQKYLALQKLRRLLGGEPHGK